MPTKPARTVTLRAAGTCFAVELFLAKPSLGGMLNGLLTLRGAVVARAFYPFQPL